MQCNSPPNLHSIPYFCSARVRDYIRLETDRVAGLNLQPRFARIYDVTRMQPRPPILYEGLTKCVHTTLPQNWDNFYDIREKFNKTNILLPCSTLTKHVTGTRFRFDNDHRIKRWEYKPTKGKTMPRWFPMAIDNYSQFS